MTSEETKWLSEIAALAISIEASYDVPPQLLIAQAAVESAWGQKPACKHNYFGMKHTNRHKLGCTVITQEVVNGKRITVQAEFADYASLEDSCQDYAWLLTTTGGPYHIAWQAYLHSRDLTALIAGVARNYSTSPSYARLVTEIAFQPNVIDAIAAARKMI